MVSCNVNNLPRIDKNEFETDNIDYGIQIYQHKFKKKYDFKSYLPSIYNGETKWCCSNHFGWLLQLFDTYCCSILEFYDSNDFIENKNTIFSPNLLILHQLNTFNKLITDFCDFRNDFFLQRKQWFETYSRHFTWAKPRLTTIFFKTTRSRTCCNIP